MRRNGSTFQDIRYTLFRLTLLALSLFSMAVLISHFFTHRPLINKLTMIGIILLCCLWYILSGNPENYLLARLSFFFIFTFIYVPFGYFTSPGSTSSMPYYIMLIFVMLTVYAVNWWEYFFPAAVIIIQLILLRTELLIPERFESFNTFDSESSRIIDLSINYTIVAVFLGLILVYVMRKYHRHNNILLNRSLTDNLTGLYNMRYLEEHAEIELDRSRRMNDHISLMFIDLNNFKRINDTLGHSEGDRVLIELAEIIRLNTRKADICARYGGDEFVIFLPSTGKEEAAGQILRLDKAFTDYSRKYRDCGFSVSFGLADNSEGSFSEMLKLADKRLYDHKAENKKSD